VVINATKDYNEFKKNTASNKKIIKNQCKGLTKENKKNCLEKSEKQIDELNNILLSKKSELDDIKVQNEIRLKEIMKEKKTLINKTAIDMSQQGIIDTKCKKKSKGKQDISKEDEKYFNSVTRAAD